MVHRIYLLIIVAGVLGVVGWFGYQYYVDTQTRIATLTANNAKLQTSLESTTAAFDTYRATVEREIEEFKAELVRQQQLNDELGANLEAVQEANKKIAGLLANTDIIKNSLADPELSESKINEQVDLFFGAIGCASGGECLHSSSGEGNSSADGSGGNTTD
jgi:parvulin-like peptidyl-prolyl isomerase